MGKGDALTKRQEQIIINRAEQLEQIGFKFMCSEDSVWYEKGNVRMNSVLMACASEGEWRNFIEQNKNPQS